MDSQLVWVAYRVAGWGNGEQQYYLTRNAAASGGSLVITIKNEQYTTRGQTWQYTSSRLKTQGLHTFSPSMGPAGIRVEARIKLPAGTHPAPFLRGESYS
jgi:hypothetical protein